MSLLDQDYSKVVDVYLDDCCFPESDDCCTYFMTISIFSSLSSIANTEKLDGRFLELAGCRTMQYLEPGATQGHALGVDKPWHQKDRRGNFLQRNSKPIFGDYSFVKSPDSLKNAIADVHCTEFVQSNNQTTKQDDMHYILEKINSLPTAL